MISAEHACALALSINYYDSYIYRIEDYEDMYIISTYSYIAELFADDDHQPVLVNKYTGHAFKMSDDEWTWFYSNYSVSYGKPASVPNIYKKFLVFQDKYNKYIRNLVLSIFKVYGNNMLKIHRAKRAQCYAHLIAKQEKRSDSSSAIIEAAALLFYLDRDTVIDGYRYYSRGKYNCCAYDNIIDLLTGAGFDEHQAKIVADMCNPYNTNKIESMYQILHESVLLADVCENQYSHDTLTQLYNNELQTNKGRKICRELFKK